tara:strand:+ start:1099 stop:1374 length:276 start_codon:yes stop_codon:yes gene_type:complete
MYKKDRINIPDDVTLPDSNNKFISEKILPKKEGGRTNKKQPNKEILGKMICIYKIPGDRKEYVKHKGKLITVKDYKKLMKAKKTTKLTKKK